MRKYFRALLAACLIAVPAFAQNEGGIYQPATPTPLVQPTPGKPVDKWASDQYGNRWVNIFNSAFTANISGTPVSIYTPTADIPVKVDSANQTPIPSSGPDLTVSGTLDMTSAASVLAISCNGYNTIVATINRGTETGSLEFDTAPDNSHWQQVAFFKDTANFTSGNQVLASNEKWDVTGNANATIFFPCAGRANARVKVNTTGSGAALPVTLIASQRPAALMIAGDFPGTDTTALGKAVNGTAGTSDVGVALLAMVNTTPAANGTPGTYSQVQISKLGAVQTDLNILYNSGGIDSIAEFLQLQGQTANAQTTGSIPLLKEYASGGAGGGAGDGKWDYATVDTSLRLWVNPFGAAEANVLQGCTAAIVNPTPVAVFTATAGTRYYIQGFRCNEQNTVASEVILQDGAGGTTLDDCWAPSNAISQENCNHPITGMPIRGSSNTALDVKATTTGTSLVCCVTGYKSTQ